MMLWLIRFIFGFLRVRFYGDFKEKIFNIAAANRISIWNSSLSKDGIEANISIRDFKRLRNIIRGKGIRIHIVNKKGLPFKTKKNQKRVGVIIGIILLLIFLKYMSGFIWLVEVTGNEKVDSGEILRACESIGIRQGIRSSDINTKTQREKLLLKLDSLAWASLNIEGCKLTVNVSEIEKKGENNECACNLKAKADGIIKKIDVTSGNCIVKIGDTVKKGDVLVSGVFEKLTGTEFVHSSGVITATTQRSVTVEGEYEKMERIENGEIKNKCVLEFFGVKIPLYLGKESKSYNQSLKTKHATLFGVNLPIKIHEKEFRFTEEYKKIYSEEELIAELENKIDLIMKNEGIEDYEITSSTKTNHEKGIKLTAVITATEDIVYREALLVANKE